MTPPTVATTYREFNLTKARQVPPRKDPAPHQRAALSALKRWFEKPDPEQGGIMVLPTGGGKTFTAVRFLCTGPLSKGYKVLWLAHTHHLLEQAQCSFGPQTDEEVSAKGCEARWIEEPKDRLHVRVVSGTPGHMPVSSIRQDDDVLIITLQTITRAYEQKHQDLLRFLKAAGDKLFVVFDEAHHSPAPSYSRLLQKLRAEHRGMQLLGLTATPTYGDEQKKGWLKKLFPQGIVYQVSAQRLIAERILAKPEFRKFSTNVTPEFSDREYQKWVGTYSDLPESIISELAANRERNQQIVDTYLQHKDLYGKTIIFAERWYQCDMLRELLLKRGVRADVVYSHIDAQGSSVEQRSQRNGNENAQVLKRFRENEIDVLINVKMLTEGTDVPKVNTVFLTRETTSRILLTQMIGRALRGPRFGGTETANIVAFIDNWRQAINFAQYDELQEGLTEDTIPEYGKHPPLQIVSIELVRRLARQMDSGLNVNPGPFLALMPLGWYRVEFESLNNTGDDTIPVRELDIVFEDEKDAFDRFTAFLAGHDLKMFADERVDWSLARGQMATWETNFFMLGEAEVNEDRLKRMLDIVRHMAQNGGLVPAFFPFGERMQHDLDSIAEMCIRQDLGHRATLESLQTEFNRTDRYWKTLYMRFDLFKSHYDACVNRLCLADNCGTIQPGVVTTPSPVPQREPSEDLKYQVKNRDGWACLCCGEITSRLLQIDHVAPAYYGGNNSMENLQTLCRACNQIKSINTLNFRIQKNGALTSPPAQFEEFAVPPEGESADVEEWKKFLKRSVNFYYRCAAVAEVRIGKKGEDFYEWVVYLYAGNDPTWMQPYLRELLNRVYEERKHLRNPSPTGLVIGAPDAEAIYTNVKKRTVDVLKRRES